ncbi:GNAT family N-acetyltransferase [Arenibaculum pallidiluteum]|uniref:GNAT family N-acetyltransferase n=1 Tax=Arenibaculum pallidiluteum TaxID=2812559 RepID=UPI001A97576C|nr:GNAT family N-acetyltransferase [Arenibaculum pallidiluteum]
MTAADADAVADLLGQLGYPLAVAEVRERFLHLAQGDDQLLLVAKAGGRVTGFLHAFAMASLHAPPRAYVQSLTVDEAARGSGVGAALMEAAETWARARGLAACTLHSQLHREGAHRFYARLGYVEKKRSAYFVKAL